MDGSKHIGSRFRWCIWTQEFCHLRADYLLSEDEYVRVCDWLERKGFKEDTINE